MFKLYMEVSTDLKIQSQTYPQLPLLVLLDIG